MQNKKAIENLVKEFDLDSNTNLTILVTCNNQTETYTNQKFIDVDKRFYDYKFNGGTDFKVICNDVIVSMNDWEDFRYYITKLVSPRIK